MSTLTITRGLPASGKTTFARQQLNAREILRPTWSMADEPLAQMIRVNRDDLRAMLHVGPWSAIQETATRDARDAIIDEAIGNGLDVICDDTHLLDSEVEWMRNLATERDAHFVVEDLRDVSIATCIERDAARDNPVGRDVIMSLARKGGLDT